MNKKRERKKRKRRRKKNLIATFDKSASSAKISSENTIGLDGTNNNQLSVADNNSIVQASGSKAS